MKGIDVSQHNGRIDWQKVKNSGIEFAILRLGWIGNKNNHTLDTTFERNYNECKRLGIPVGVYVYNYCSSVDKIKSGANWTIQKLQGKKLDLPVYIDMEDASIKGLGKNTLTNMCIAFNSIIEAAHLWAGVYANLDWFNNYLNKNEIKRRYTTWIAHYGVSINKYKGQYDMLQYTSSGRVSGISGNVDMNELYRNLVAEINGNKTVTPVIPTAKYSAGSYQVTANVLNVRSGAGTKYRIVTTIRKGSKQGVDRVEGDWGHLMNNAGWICLNYCKKI